MMLFAITVSPTGMQIVQTGPDAPRHAQCVYCGMTVELLKADGAVWHYKHASKDAAFDCQRMWESEQAKLDRVLNVNR